MFEEEKTFDSGTRFFWKIAPNWVYFGQREDFKQTTEKVQYSRNQVIKTSQTSLNEATMLMAINEALLSR